MNLARVKLITFDVTDTLLQFRIPLGKQYSEIGLMHGVICDWKMIQDNFKTHWNVLTKEHPNFGRETGIGWQQWWKLMVIKIFKESCKDPDENQLNKVAATLIQMYGEAECWQHCYGALALLSYLRNKRITIGIVSNFDERLPALLDKTNLSHYFKFVLASYTAGFEKPDIRIFEEAMKESNILGLKQEECLHIGDSAELDYLGARNAGWNAILLNKKKLSELQLKNINVNSNDIYKNLYDLHKFFVDVDSKKEKL